ncbi:hypothetical protein QBC47DRAFT_400302 [Echria macrotheca]|uniref:Uncharacterized protein n=1 Tax=Echria macrotheca TaxID=438768 RepID=A0AAJ0F6B8_9PEZI|nr:hypothetical protein QBC47DRAFT_400302 [Echria macrotheca]
MAYRRSEASGLSSQGVGSELQDAYLGIDIGSHRTRACIWHGGIEIIIQNKYSFGLESNCYAGDFPSNLYVFDDSGPVYLIDRHDPSRQSVSAKYVFYALANASDALLEQYPSVHPLMARKDDQSFLERLREGVVALLSVLQDLISTMCLRKRLRIARVGLTIPVQWTLEFEDVYRALVCEVFGLDTRSIFFYTETEALARYLFKFHSHELDPDNRYDSIAFFDFGGHNMNGCVFGVARDEDHPEANSFFRAGKPFGAGGGSEQWEHHIGEWFSRLWTEVIGSPPPPEHREDALSRFRIQKGRKAEDVPEKITLTFALDDEGSSWRVNLTRKTIEEAWRKGLDRPLDKAQHEISRLVKMEENDRIHAALVVVSGGTARNPAVKSRMLEICERRGVPVVFTDDFDIHITYDSAKVAKAAAFAVSEMLTVEQFLGRGAAIGLQMRQAVAKLNPKAHQEWDQSAALVLDGFDAREATFSVRRNDNFRLICDPFFQRLGGDQRNSVAASRAYDVVYLGTRSQGQWKFRMELEGSNDDVILVLMQKYKRNRKAPWKAADTLRLPVYFDGNSGCIQVGDRSSSLDELCLGLPPQPGDTAGTFAYEAEESDFSDPEDPEPEESGDQPQHMTDHDDSLMGTAFRAINVNCANRSPARSPGHSNSWRPRRMKPQHSLLGDARAPRVDPYATARAKKMAQAAVDQWEFQGD